MRQRAALAMLVLLMLSACAPSAEAVQTAVAQTQAVAAPDLLTSRLIKLLEDGSTLCAMTAQGASFDEFRQQLAVTKGDYSLALSSQSAERSIPPEAVTELDAAFTGWDLAYSVWHAQLNGGGPPRAPDAVRYPELVEYIGLEKLPVVDSGSGSYVDPDRVINILLYRATDHFNIVQAILLAEMP